MDVERTMQFIVESQAKMTAHQQVADERMKRLDQRLDILTSNVERLTGVVEPSFVFFVESKADTDRRIHVLDEALKSLAEAQRVTEVKLQAFIDNLSKGRNGHA